MNDKYKITSEHMTGEGASKIFAWRVNDSYSSFNSEEDALAAIDLLNAETAPLHDDIATLRAALQAQSEELARLRKELEGLSRYAYKMSDYAGKHSEWGTEFENLEERIDAILNWQDSTESASDE